MSNTTKAKRKQSSTLLKELLLTCPETGERQTIVNVESKEGAAAVITTKGKTTSWKHTIHTEEV